jgi:diguanylate cyclase (GGDEF)-like protein
MTSSPKGHSFLAEFSSASIPTILVVDDQPINIQVIHQIFSTHHTILMATSGEQALTICANQQPDLVLLDIEMPGMNGFEVCEQLKANPLTFDIPVIFISAHNNVPAEVRGLEVGAVDFITKPINPQIVRARVKTHLTLKAQSDLLRDWAYLDGLTNIFNRRHFDNQLSIEWGRSLRTNSALSLVMIDVDYFKAYNDFYGHQAGDDCLRLIAATIKNATKRFGDFVARYGGEEFICLLPNTPLEGAMIFAEQIRVKVSELGISHTQSPIQPFVSISAGVGAKEVGTKQVGTKQVDTKEESPVKPNNSTATETHLVQLSDKQLYQAKHQGRNQVSGKSL